MEEPVRIEILNDRHDALLLKEEQLFKLINRTKWHRDYFQESGEYDKAVYFSDILYSMDD